MEALGAPGSLAAGSGPALVRYGGGIAGTCRCGRSLDGHDDHVAIIGAPPTLGPLLGTQVFCSRGCVRAFFLEAMETLDALDSPSSELIISDLHVIYLALAHTFAEILGDAAPPKD